MVRQMSAANLARVAHAEATVAVRDTLDRLDQLRVSGTRFVSAVRHDARLPADLRLSYRAPKVAAASVHRHRVEHPKLVGMNVRRRLAPLAAVNACLLGSKL